MKDWQIFLILFGAFNLCVFIFRRALSNLVLGFFALGRKLCPPEVSERRVAKLGFGGFFSALEFTNPSRQQVIRVLAWTGAINFLGCLGFYLLIESGVFADENPEEGDASSLLPPATALDSKL